MAACSHDNCEHGHWSGHRHCSVSTCPYVEKRGSRLGSFVNGMFVCPAHGTAIGAKAAWADFASKTGEQNGQ